MPNMRAIVNLKVQYSLSLRI
uniref:Uncharacterized protein n=1 Tax=Rhizophora mucronata TaxID=61149 RepID=A0A2P2R2E1_RHIMU